MHRRGRLGRFAAIAATLGSLSLPVHAATVSLWSPTSFDRGGGAGTDVVVPVSVSPADGITSMALAIAYDPAIATPTGVYRTPLTHGLSLTSDLTVPGAVALGLDGPPLSGSGEVAWIVFRVTAASGATDLTWTSASLNGGAIPAVTQDGRIPLVSAASVGSVPDDAHGSPGATVDVPVTFAPIAGSSSVDLRVKFDPNVWTLTSVLTTPLSAGMTLTWNLIGAGEVGVSLFQSQPLAGSGAIVILRGTVVGPIGEATPLNLTRGDLDETHALLDDGLLTSCSTADADGDTFTGCGGDCDDANAAVHPGTEEVCNGIDDDCNGSVDEGVAQTFYGDADGDGYGADGEVTQACEQPPGTAPVGGDCDDANPAVHPGAAEVCNGLDDDCDLAIDEDVPVPAVVTALAARRMGEVVELSWPAVPSGQTYDVTRGDLGALRSSGGDWAPSVRTCVADGTTSLTVVDPSPAGALLWYVARAANCGGDGSWSDGAASEHGGRDSGIGASPATCP